ncbi:MAG: DUF2442 domain-containing protein [Pseudorhodoplanes sp.]|nr:DUF2442 domain-containing protein [Pseudorhodoplanes sp.]
MMDCRVKFATGPTAGRTRLPGNDRADRSRANTLGINATPEQRTKVEISRTGLHWEDIDEDISVAGLIAGRGDMTKRVDHAANRQGRQA